jgi:hypothetical protein
MRIISIVLLFLTSISLYSQGIDFEEEYKNVIQNNDFNSTLEWLTNHKYDYINYMNGFSTNIATLAYKEKKFNSMKAALKFQPNLLSLFVGSYAGGHDSTPPTIFITIKNNDIVNSQYLLDIGVSKDLTWNRIAFFPENLLSSAKTPEMIKLLESYNCSRYITVNNYICTAIDNNINVRDSPNGKVLFQVSKNTKGFIVQITLKDEIISGNTGRWCRIIFDNNKEGWSFSSFYHIPWLDGM